jgi:hypothetical protein
VTDEILEAEGRKAWELHQSGVLREPNFSADNYEAVLVLECDSADEAAARLQVVGAPSTGGGVFGHNRTWRPSRLARRS